MNARSLAMAIAALLAASPIAWVEAQTQPSPEKEATGSGSGSTGNAPQQGTGSGSTQSPPQGDPGKGGDPNSPLNRDYGRETTPSGQPLNQNNPPASPSP